MSQERPTASGDLDPSIHATFENEAVGMAFISSDGRWLRVNAKLSDITGYTQEELLERNVADITHQEDVDVSIEQLQRVHQGKARSYTIEKRYVRKDGSIVPVRKSVSLVRGADGSPAYLIAVVDDITQRKFAEAELAFQKYALDQSAIVAITDVQGTITYVNDKFCDISGYSRDELIGQNHRIINSGLHPRSFFRDMYLTISRGKVWRGEIRNRRKDGSFYWVDTTIVPAMDTYGKPERYVAIRTDITERKRIEEQLRQSDSRKDEFLAVLSHELRNPMAAIRMATAVLKSDGQSAHGPMISIIERQSQQLGRLVDDLLDVSRITRGGLRMERIDVVAIIAEACEGAVSACRQKGVDFSMTLPKDRVFIMGDALRVSQVLGNLLNNAIKFTAAGGHISVVGSAEGDEAVVRVRDTGIGIPPDQLTRVFEMFAQVDPEVRKTGGPGHRAGSRQGDHRAARRQRRGPQRGAEQGERVHRPRAAGAFGGDDRGGRRR